MSLKRFNADVRAARERLHEKAIPGIAVIERGDSEGEVVVTLVHKNLPKPLPIRVLTQNVDEYPDGNSFLLFTDSDDVTGNITTTLEELQNFTFGQKILEAITTLSTGVQRALDNVDSEGDTIMDGMQDPHLPDYGADNDDGEEPYDDFDDADDEEFGLGPSHPPGTTSASRWNSVVLRRIRRDLRKAREVGCKVGILGGLGDSRTLLLSLSVRTSKLGLSQEALEAWDVEASDYIVLLVRIDGLYPCAEEVAQNPSANFHIHFRFGKCTKYKPSFEQALAAFTATTQKPTKGDTTLSTENDDQRFRKVFISASLEQFMSESFIPLLKLRFRGCATWDVANAELRNLASKLHDGQTKGKEKNSTNPISANKSNGKAMGASGSTGTNPTGESRNAPKALPNVLLFDSLAEHEPSVPLIAMQFAIHYFVRCTEYCLRCHRRIDKEFEALKPFVCSDPLCLFQYITMGFGPSIEHEIVTQPYVVDLLICLCYSSVQTPYTGYHQQQATEKYPIRDFPSGLRLKVPSTMAEPVMDVAPIKVSVDLALQKATFSCIADIGNITGGTWIVLRHSTNTRTGQSGHTFHHHAYIKYVDRQTSSFTFDLKRADPVSSAAHGQIEGTIVMELLVYNMEFEDLSDSSKAKAMISILDTIPPVAQIREYLIKNPHSNLRSCHSMSPAAATLLEWIVSPVDDHHAPDKELLATIKTRDQEVIPSMKSCVQFRFAQGAPDKELRFHRALRDLQAQKQTKYSTLFAWHGSALGNWHSILRQGLDFNEVKNGRAFGNGVYFSQNFFTSTSYSSRLGTGSTWPYSALNGSGVISLCEIVNSPEDFVSTTPHLVVNQVDWIQCRYLFVQPWSGLSTSTSSVDTNTARINEIQQDPAHSVYGPDNTVLKIPLKAIPSGRVSTSQSKKKPSAHSSSKRAYETVCSTGGEDEEDEADIVCLLSSEDESSEPPSKRISSDPARDSSVDTATARDLTVRRPLTPPHTDFRPGTLDLTTLPQLPVPEWANPNSTKRLASDIKHMQKVQASTPLHELGWYIDFDKVDNMFQWIVELHSFDPSLPLAKDMKKAGVTSIVLEVRFGREYPFSPPFVRVIRPRFLPFASGGGGHVTIGGAMCLELLTSTGWSPVTSMEAVFLSVRMAMSETEPAARLQTTHATARAFDYAANEALDAYVRFAGVHGWKVPGDLWETAGQMAKT
ncbi:hypothetical protein VMCG_08968 [Cytospora schulzeri]|uniref:UBC core domain-containing protein n=1 Tax=Cytospora schulzeri TaxID=448051 RepID=A0A423VNN5_9PEZI|nr:hypothetical protein VMCG_08968 [Valsa malicola]